MIDIHTHLLPRIDDGSRSVENTLEMLDIMVKDGVETVVATPHFYNETSVEHFCEKRQKAYEKVADKKPDGIDIRLGAEVKLEYGISEIEDLEKLKIEGTDYMLVELPYFKWEGWVYDELFKISSNANADIIIAHADRYMDLNSVGAIEKLVHMDFKIQVNIDDMFARFRRSISIGLMKKGLVDYIASDCHNLDSRPPRIGDAFKKVSAKMGLDYANELMDNAKTMLGILRA